MKKFIVILLTVALVLSFCACGKSEKKDDTKVTEVPTAAPTEVPTEQPTKEPTPVPTQKPTPEPVATIEPGKETYAEGIASDKALSYTFASTATENRHYMVQDSIAIQFFATVSFDKIEISCPSYNDDLGTIDFALLKWMGTYDATIDESNTPVATASYVDYKDNSLLAIKPETALPDGEYLIYITSPDPENCVGIWAKQPGEDDTCETRFYASDVEFPAVMAMPKIHYTKTPNKCAGPLMDSGIEE